MIPLTVLVLLLLAYCVIDIGASWGKIHSGVSVQGVDVGGLSQEEASTKLQEELTPVLNSVTVSLFEDEEAAAVSGVSITQESDIDQAYADEASGSDTDDDGVIDTWTVTANTIGAYIDGEALAQQAYQVGRSGNFVADRFLAWFTGKDIAATISCSEERFNSLVSEINAAIGCSIVDSTASIESGVVSVSPGSDGLSVDQSALTERLSAAVFSKGAHYLIIPMKTDAMHITPETAQRVADSIQTAIAEYVTITYEQDSWVLDSATLGDMVSQVVLEPDRVLKFSSGMQSVVSSSEEAAAYDVSAGVDASSGYILQAYVDQEKIDAYLVDILGDRAQGGAQDASFDTSSGEVVIIESVTGTGPDRASAGLQLQDILFGERSSDRTIALVDTTIVPDFTTEDAQAMGITEKLSSWSIALSGTSARINNIRLLCEMINGSLVAPGEVWSFNGTTGERTAEKGFETAPVIVNGKHEDQLGGGICQVATCVFNAACYAGLGIEARTNHDFYISAYDDKGFADATVSWETPDLQWKNDTENYILLTADASGDYVVITLWGTYDGRTVTCDRGEWKEGDSYVTIYEEDDTLEEGTQEVEQTGQNGCSIDIHYVVTDADGNVIHDIMFHSVYSAQNEIIKVGTMQTTTSTTEEDSS